jgi:ABC-2 type transport system permease protein
MTRLIRTEWLKLRTTRGPWAAIAGVIALSALITPFAMADIGRGSASAAADAREALAIGPGFLTAIVLLLLGALAAAVEFQHRSVVATYLVTPRRGRVLAAKLAAHGLLGAVVAGAGAAITFPVVLSMAHADGIHVASTGHLAGVAVGLVAAGGLAAACGVAVGSILRHQTAAIIAILVWTLLVEKLFSAFLPPLMPFGSILAAVGMAGDDGPGILAALMSLTAWAGLLAVVAARRFVRLDVTA